MAISNNDRRTLYYEWSSGEKKWADYESTFFVDGKNSDPVATDISKENLNNSKQYHKRTGIYGTYYGSYITEKGAQFEVKSSVNYKDDSPQVTNIRYIYTYLTNCGWHRNAIIGVLGNIHAECKLNPGLWQSQSIGSTGSATGFGLVQWTPACKKHIGWCMGYRWKANYNTSPPTWYVQNSADYGGDIRYLDPSSMDSQLAHIADEMDPKNSKEGGDVTTLGGWAGEWQKTKMFPLSKKNFIEAKDDDGNELSADYLTRAFVVNYLRCAGYELKSTQDERASHTALIIKYAKYDDSYEHKYDSNVSYDNVIKNPILPFYKMCVHYSRNPEEGNCTWYGYARTWHINAIANGLSGDASYAVEPKHLRFPGKGNAGNWYGNLRDDPSFPRERLSENIPMVGAIACWKSQSKSDSGWGHIVIVESIKYGENGDWESFQYSHSGYTKPLFATGTFKNDGTTTKLWPGTDYVLQGFIYNENNFSTSFNSTWNPLKTIEQIQDVMTLKFTEKLNSNKVSMNLLWSLTGTEKSTNSNMITVGSLNTSLNLPKNTEFNAMDVNVPPFASSVKVSMKRRGDSDKIDSFDISTDVGMTYPCVYIGNNGECCPYVPLMYSNSRWSVRTPYIAYDNEFYKLKNRISSLVIEPDIPDVPVEPDTPIEPTKPKEPIVIVKPSDEILLGVETYLQQTTYTCGASSAVMILQYFKKLPSDATRPYDKYLHTKWGYEAHKAMATSSVTNILNTYISGKPYSYEPRHDDVSKIWEQLVYSIKAGYPVVALIKIENTKYFTYTTTGHYVVVDGVDVAKKTVHICDPNGKTKPKLTMPFDTFVADYYTKGNNPQRMVLNLKGD